MKTKSKNKYITSIGVAIICVFALLMVLLTGCSQADSVRHNIQKDADKFDVYRKITFVNLQTGQLLYSAEGYFSLQTTVNNEYQGQQEIGLVFKISQNEYKMDYFSINNNVAYVIEQTQNTTTDPYHWKIVWYVALPENVGG